MVSYDYHRVRVGPVCVSRFSSIRDAWALHNLERKLYAVDRQYDAQAAGVVEESPDHLRNGSAAKVLENSAGRCRMAEENVLVSDRRRMSYHTALARADERWASSVDTRNHHGMKQAKATGNEKVHHMRAGTKAVGMVHSPHGQMQARGAVKQVAREQACPVLGVDFWHASKHCTWAQAPEFEARHPLVSQPRRCASVLFL